LTTVLLLSSRRAKWIDTSAKESQWHESDLSDSDESLVFPEAAQIHLLLDSEFEQIDAFPVVKTNAVLSYRSNLRALHTRFVQQFPLSIVRSPRRKTGVDCFLVHQLNMTTAVKRYLQRLEAARLSSVIISIQSISEIYVSVYAESAQTRLLLISTEAGVKHVVGKSGCVVFCRTVLSNSSYSFSCEQIVASLNETIEHLKNTALVCEFNPIATIGISHEQTLQLEACAETLKEPLQFEVFQPSSAEVSQFLAKQTPIFAKRHKHCLFRKTGQWLQKYRARRRDGRLRAAALGSLVLLIASVAIMQQRKNTIQSEKEELQLTLERLSTELAETQKASNELSERHNEVAAILLDVNNLNVVKAPGTEQLLKPLSHALQTHTKINLSELSWITEEKLSQSGSRSFFPVEGSSPSALLVSLGGSVQGVGTIRMKQDTFKQFVQQLKTHDYISAIDVVQSPLDSAVPRSNGGAMARSMARFEISFTFSRS